VFFQEVQHAVDPMNPQLLPEQFVFSTFVVWAIDALKRAKWFPWLDVDTEKINRAVACFAAALTAASIHFVMEAGEETGSYTIHLTGMTLDNVWHFTKGFAIAIASQQTILVGYQIRNLLRDVSKHMGHRASEESKISDESKIIAGQILSGE